MDDLEKTLRGVLTKCPWLDTMCVNIFVSFIINVECAMIDALVATLNGCNKKLSKIDKRIFLTSNGRHFFIRVGYTKKNSEIIAKTKNLLKVNDYILQAFGSLVYKNNILTE